jgi:pyridoxamine 5'-phosphate oxidase
MPSDSRITYAKDELLESEVAADPVQQFAVWFEEAGRSGDIEPNAMALATVSADGTPNCRMVLLKDFDASGFVFYTNLQSRKGVELAANPRATLLFYWPELERQVRIAGTVEQVTREESERYFRSRPVGHRLGAWASRQSAVVENRDKLEHAAAEAARRFEGADVPLPPYWGGYRVRPSVLEFWQGRADRLHDRIEYLRDPAAGWILRRLAP